MTDRSPARRARATQAPGRPTRRRHAAAGSRVLVAGASTAGLVALVGAMAQAGPAVSATGTIGVTGATAVPIAAPTAAFPDIPARTAATLPSAATLAVVASSPAPSPIPSSATVSLAAAELPPVGHTRGS